VLSAIYLLWAYQRVALGEVTVDKNRVLPDASQRERVILGTLAAVILFMGIASPLFTRRMEASTDNVLKQMERIRDASQPVHVQPPTTQIILPSKLQADGSLAKATEMRVRP
jgi:NADH:ubiquinone oxidoreductase subunit 4 (subunit M)